MYGQETISIKGKDIIVSSKERTLVDLIDYNKPVGGIEAAADILKRFVQEKKCDVKKLIDYTVRFPKIKVRKRIGFILDSVSVGSVLLKPLEKSVKKTSLISFTNNRKGTINKKWRIIVNDSQR